MTLNLQDPKKYSTLFYWYLLLLFSGFRDQWSVSKMAANLPQFTSQYIHPNKQLIEHGLSRSILFIQT